MMRYEYNTNIKRAYSLSLRKKTLKKFPNFVEI